MLFDEDYKQEVCSWQDCPFLVVLLVCFFRDPSMLANARGTDASSYDCTSSRSMSPSLDTTRSILSIHLPVEVDCLQSLVYLAQQVRSDFERFDVDFLQRIPEILLVRY